MRKGLLALLVAIVPLAPIVAGVVLGLGGGAASAQTKLTLTPAAAPAGASSKLSARPSSSSVLPPGSGAVVAVIRHTTAMRGSPGGSTIATVGTRTPFGSAQVFWVVRHTRRWLGVISPQAGNNRVGWVPLADATLTRVSWKLNVSLAARQLTVRDGGQVVKRFAVAIGMPYAPTPTGRFAVTDRLFTGDPSGPYGCCILALSAEAPHAIQGWTGGNRIAIHSTPETWTIGQAASHGCLRLTIAEGRWLLAHIPLGTPAIISSA